MAFERVLMALLWSFHNSRDGRCFPGYERIAEQARCARSTVAEALRALEWAGVLTWQHRITRVRERCTDLFGRITWRWRVIRTSNAYVFRDPKPQLVGVPASKSENPSRTQVQDILDPVATPARNLDSPLDVPLPDSTRLLQPRFALNKALTGRPDRKRRQEMRKRERARDTEGDGRCKISAPSGSRTRRSSWLASYSSCFSSYSAGASSPTTQAL
jgi:hypothetical protein